MPLTLYLDTSVYGGYYDDEFKLWTQTLFQQIFDGEHVVASSSIVLDELESAPERIQSSRPPDYLLR